ncbi:SMI1/KNR4 family protein [Pseudalkalibacillus sp. JSM 102089]|uniref:SMI1/KNR4 family protein n=1 Tax=Pseudalkalibacillus sp. JSM 102089 TaxID=3229856 RepID=UPI0035242532
MAEIFGSHDNLSIEKIESFENENNVKLTEQYIKFLLKWNGGKVKPNLFMISNEQGPSVLNVFYGIGDMYDNLTDFIEIMDERLPVGFIPIGDDPSGNVICIGTKKPYYDKIYFWDHEQEPEDPNNMSNMYFLANDIDEFLSNLYEEPEV